MDMRDAFFASLYDVIAKDKNVILITPDHGAFGVDRIREDFPKQYLNVGIAEQNTISIAAGLALSGKIVYVYGIVNFITMRCLEQINVDIASMNLHVNIIGVGAGFTYSTDGFTHHGTQDIAIMSAIPNMQIYNCSDAINASIFAKFGYLNKGPKYIRIEKGEVPDLYETQSEEHPAFDGLGFQDIGIGRIKDGKEVFIISSGRMVHKAISISEKLFEQNTSVGVLDIYKLKPFPSELLAYVIKDSKLLIVLEDNIAIGGLADRICSTLVDYRLMPKVLKLNVGDSICFKSSIDREWVEQQMIGGDYII